MGRVGCIVAVALTLAGCGGGHGIRAPTGAERKAITRAVHRWWLTEADFSAVRNLGLHDVVRRIRVSRRDTHFALVDIAPTDRHRKQTLETAQVGVVLVAGKWTIAVGPGTDLSEVCTAASPRALVDLICP
jgi:hypothetical protein